MSWENEQDWYDVPEEEDPWSSIVDLMSAFALVLFLAVTFFIINSSQAQQKLKLRQQLLVKKEKALQQSLVSLKQKTVSLAVSQKSEEELLRQKALLESNNQEIQKRLLLLKEKEKEHLALQEKLLGEKKALLQEQEKLKEGQIVLRKLAQQKEVLVQKNQQLLQQKQEQTNKQELLLSEIKKRQQHCEEKLQELLRKRKTILNAIHQVFSSSSSTVSGVGFDKKTGKFRLGGEVLFAKGKSFLTDDGKKQLRAVYRALTRVLGQKGVSDMVDGIMVEGHTSLTGTAQQNWFLSSRRSLAAVVYLLSLSEGNTTLHKQLSKLFYASAFGQYRPILHSTGSVDNPRSRRIEIKVVFKSQSKLNELFQKLK